MAFADIRKMLYQNPTSLKIYEVVYKRNTNATIDIVGILLGTNRVNSDPVTGDAKISGVVVTSKIADVFGLSAKTDVHLQTAAIYDASNRGAAGAALATLLV